MTILSLTIAEVGIGYHVAHSEPAVQLCGLGKQLRPVGYGLGSLPLNVRRGRTFGPAAEREPCVQGGGDERREGGRRLGVSAVGSVRM